MRTCQRRLGPPLAVMGVAASVLAATPVRRSASVVGVEVVAELGDVLGEGPLDDGA